MNKIATALDSSTNTTSDVFKLQDVDEFSIHCEDGGGGFGAGSITLQIRAQPSGSWVNFTSGGSDVTFTTTTRDKSLTFGGCEMRLSAGASITDVDAYVTGPNVRID